MMNFNKHKTSVAPNNNQPNRRQKTVPSNNMNSNPNYNNSPYTQKNTTPNNSVNHTQYNTAMSPRNANTKSPRPTKKKKVKKKDKRIKNIAENNVLRERSHTTPHTINNININNNNKNNTKNNNNLNNNNNNNNPHQLYMSTTQHISPHKQKMNNQTWVSPQQRPNMNRPNSPHINNRHNKPPPPQRERHPWKSHNTNNNNNNNNSNNNTNKIGQITTTQTNPTTHNATGTMIAHTNRNTLDSDDDDNDMSNQSPITGVSAYHNRQDCVWNINQFQQQDVASNFACQTCGDIPKLAFAYTCDLELIYCEYCIDIKYRKNEVKQKKRMPQMVQNMINVLKIKCARYAQCKFRGNVRSLTQHYKICIEKIKKKAINKSASECPLKYMGCTQFNGGYINQHYDESQQQHLNLIISFVENKFRKYDNKLQQTDQQINKLQKQNLELKNEISLLQTSNNKLSQQLLSLLKNNDKNNNKNGYKIVVNNGKKNMEHKMNGDNDNNGTETDGQWNSFINAHRRLSTKTGATMPGNEEEHLIHGTFSAQLLSNPNPQSYNTAISSSYDSSMRTDDTTSEDDDAKQMELPISDQKMVVIDIGSQLSKVGLAGSNKPTVIFQSMVAKHKLNGSRTIIGDKIDKLTNYQCGYPIDRGIIKNYGDYESIIHSIFYDKLQINPHEYNALMIEPILSPKKQSNKILEICFEKFNLNALFLAVDALCALYASGGNTGLSVSSGHGVTCVVPIYEGYVIPHAAQRLEYGGYDISNYLKDKLNLHGLFRSLLSENKFADSLKQKLSYVAQDYKIEKQHTMFERIVYRLPDGSEIEVGQERFECTESLFNSERNSNSNFNGLSISNLVNKSLLNASDDIRQVLFENIVCSGGNTMLKGFDDRLKKEVDKNAPENSGWNTRVFGLVDRKLSCWIGGSIMASLSHMDQLWITRKQYQDIGPNILNRQY